MVRLKPIWVKNLIPILSVFRLEDKNQTNLLRKRAPRSFGFGTAMEVRPVRGSTSSCFAEAYQQSGTRFKQEIIEIASEEFRYIAER